MARTPLFYKKNPGGPDTILDVSKIPGSIFYVDSTSAGKGDTAGHGASPDSPFATIEYAVQYCTANKGDVIFVMPGHAETLGNESLVINVAGVSIIGLGRGGNMPLITHGHANSEVSIAADNVTWQGIHHRAAITSVAVAIEIEDGSDYCTVRNCVFDVATTTTDEFLVTIRTNDASNNALVESNDIDMGLGGAVAAISFTKDTDSTTVRNNRIQGDYSTACINGLTTLSSKLDIDGNLLINGNGSNIGTEPGIELLTGSYGTIRNNLIVCNLATKAAAIVADTCLLFNNYYNEDISGAATGGIIGTASADD